MSSMRELEHSRSLRTPRLFVSAALEPDAVVALGAEQTHYLLRVMRLPPDAEVLAFNGRDGLWAAGLQGNDRRRISLRVRDRVAPQPDVSGPWLAFGIPKRHALELIIQKGTELGVTRFKPVASTRAMAERLNFARLERIAIEAAEQCERLDVPSVDEVVRIEELLADWPAERTLFCADESGTGEPIADAADAMLGDEAIADAPPWGLLIGPEGGFAPGELDGHGELPFVRRVFLGPRILRAETAAVAGLAVCQALTGDWDLPA
jgi:16S rRNA (uracil1498-N3)-methyltransferase